MSSARERSDRPPASKPDRAVGLPAADVRPLLDGATPSVESLDPELEAARRIASDPAQDLEDRLEAYEDIFDSEVGDTPLSRARNFERETGLRQVFLKFEGGNPSGTHKDRIAFAQAMDALRRGFDTITVATCGNYGAAMAFAAGMAGLRCLIYVPPSFERDACPRWSGTGQRSGVWTPTTRARFWRAGKRPRVGSTTTRTPGARTRLCS